jgi:hypothetical protein
MQEQREKQDGPSVEGPRRPSLLSKGRHLAPVQTGHRASHSDLPITTTQAFRIVMYPSKE